VTLHAKLLSADDEQNAFTGKSQDAPSISAALPLVVGMNGQQMCTVIDSTPGFFTATAWIR
jgi:hypothetical protein